MRSNWSFIGRAVDILVCEFPSHAVESIVGVPATKCLPSCVVWRAGGTTSTSRPHSIEWACGPVRGRHGLRYGYARFVGRTKYQRIGQAGVMTIGSQ